MDIPKKMAELFEAGLREVLEREISEPGYLAQEDFGNCTERADAIIADASEKATQYLALAIAHHRKDKHGEDTSSEIAELEAVVGEELSEETVSAAGFWIW